MERLLVRVRSVRWHFGLQIAQVPASKLTKLKMLIKQGTMGSQISPTLSSSNLYLFDLYFQVQLWSYNLYKWAPVTRYSGWSSPWEHCSLFFVASQSCQTYVVVHTLRNTVCWPCWDSDSTSNIPDGQRMAQTASDLAPRTDMLHPGHV